MKSCKFQAPAGDLRQARGCGDAAVDDKDVDDDDDGVDEGFLRYFFSESAII